jgi:hypothetical protein
MTEDHRDLDKACREIINRMRRKQLTGLLEVLLGDLVALDGIDATKAVLARFQDQLEHY